MTHYVASLDHFRFEREGDTLVVTSYRDDFRKEYDWPDDLDTRNENLEEELHERFYLQTREAYQS